MTWEIIGNMKYFLFSLSFHIFLTDFQVCLFSLYRSHKLCFMRKYLLLKCLLFSVCLFYDHFHFVFYISFSWSWLFSWCLLVRIKGQISPAGGEDKCTLSNSRMFIIMSRARCCSLQEHGVSQQIFTYVYCFDSKGFSSLAVINKEFASQSESRSTSAPWNACYLMFAVDLL